MNHKLFGMFLLTLMCGVIVFAAAAAVKAPQLTNIGCVAIVAGGGKPAFLTERYVA